MAYEYQPNERTTAELPQLSEIQRNGITDESELDGYLTDRGGQETSSIMMNDDVDLPVR